MDWILGSSHVVRWKNSIAQTSSKCLGPERLIGFGGVPIWSKKAFEAATLMVSTTERVGIVIPDFRVGNSICLTNDAANPVMLDGFSAIDARAIGPEHDRAMLTRSIEALRMWHEAFGPRARFVFWNLFGNQVHDRLAGRYVVDNRYQHPVFKWDEIVNALPGADIVDLSPLLKMPMHEVKRLFVDSSAHPSYIGYQLLDGLLCQGLNATVAYKQAVVEVEAILFELGSRIHTVYGEKIVLTGRSVWLDTLVRYMGATGSERLAEAGIILAPLNPITGQHSTSPISNQTKLRNSLALIFSDGAELAAPLASAFGTDITAWKAIPYVDWENAVAPIIIARGATPSFKKSVADAPIHLSLEMSFVDDSMVELGTLGTPSWNGLIAVLKNLASGVIKPGRIGGVRIDGDVLLTENGIAFLIGGTHSVIKFATGEIKPSGESLKNFENNIASRASLAARAQIPFTHVIFPDKQSVLSDYFPYQPVHRLGDYYLTALSQENRAKVIYPADGLKGASPVDVFLPLDTHMTDHGTLAVLRIMLDSIGIEAMSSLQRISVCIKRSQRWAGDLGSKFTPTLMQEGLILDPDWPMIELRSPGGFNDGMIDLIFSPEAQHNRTVLLFGDSFFRMMLKQLSAVFTKVVCLRTRHMHPEMVALIRPDIIFTGNAERYLSAVTSDEEAHAFMLYPFLRIMPLDSDVAFLNAWRAVTSPGSQQARTLFAEYGLPTS